MRCHSAGIEPQRVLPLVALFMAVTLGLSFIYALLRSPGTSSWSPACFERREAPILFRPGRSVADATGARVGRPVLLATLVLAVLAILAAIFLLRRLDVSEDAAVTAHRGASLHAPENSMAAFREAFVAGTDYVELDVQRTRDGAIVVIHDGDLMRMGGDPRKVKDLTLAEIQAIDIGRKRGRSTPANTCPRWPK